jgi:Na+/melibiose symporter-like transporter
MSNIAGLCALPLWTRLSRGRDKKAVYLLAVLGSTVMAASWAFASPLESNLVFGLRSFLMGAFGAGGLVMGFSMLPDTIEYDRLTTGLDRAGLYTGLLGFIEKNAAAIAPMIIGFYFAAMGIVQSSTGNVEQPDSAITAIIAGKAWIPAGFNIVAAVILMSYRLTEGQLAALRLQVAGRSNP